MIRDHLATPDLIMSSFLPKPFLHLHHFLPGYHLFQWWTYQRYFCHLPMLQHCKSYTLFCVMLMKTGPKHLLLLLFSQKGNTMRKKSFVVVRMVYVSPYDHIKINLAIVLGRDLTDWIREMTQLEPLLKWCNDTWSEIPRKYTKSVQDNFLTDMITQRQGTTATWERDKRRDKWKREGCQQDRDVWLIQMNAEGQKRGWGERDWQLEWKNGC